MSARIVGVAEKPEVARRAVARGRLRLRPATIAAIEAGRVEKGNVLAAAEVAALQAAKRTPDLLPYCHPIPITGVEARFVLAPAHVEATVTVDAVYRTGVEMEALTAVAVGLLAVWDMVKPLEKDATGQYPDACIEDVRVLSKQKGGSVA